MELPTGRVWTLEAALEDLPSIAWTSRYGDCSLLQ